MRSVAGTTKWLHEAQHAGVQAQVFLSSLTSSVAGERDYSRAEQALEQKFVEAGKIVFRLGLVIGPGGAFADLVDSVTRYPVVPMLDRGAQLVNVLGADALVQIVRDGIVSQGGALQAAAWNLHQPEPYSLREVVGTILRQAGRRRMLIPLPAGPVIAALSLFERQRLVRLPVTSASVRGMIEQGRRSFPSDYERFGYPVRSLDELVSAALSPRA
jgi:nucleoside-diphosphate-sugar epimerase